MKQIAITTHSPLIDSELERQIYDAFGLPENAFEKSGMSAKELESQYNVWKKKSVINLNLSKKEGWQ